MSYGVHKVTSVHGTMCEKILRFLTHRHTDRCMDGRYYQVPTGICRGIKINYNVIYIYYSVTITHDCLASMYGILLN